MCRYQISHPEVTKPIRYLYLYVKAFFANALAERFSHFPRMQYVGCSVRELQKLRRARLQTSRKWLGRLCASHAKISGKGRRSSLGGERKHEADVPVHHECERKGELFANNAMRLSRNLPQIGSRVTLQRDSTSRV